jgi:RNA polymerase sigma factor (sigma-70 family)
MTISESNWEQTQYNLVQDFLDLLLPPKYDFVVENDYPKSVAMKALTQSHINDIKLPQSKLLQFETLLEESNLENFPSKEADWAIIFAFEILRGVGTPLGSDIDKNTLDGLKLLANEWGSYLARELTRFFKEWQLFTVFSDGIFDLLAASFCQLPAKQLGEAIRESITPAYLRSQEVVSYEFAVFYDQRARMKESRNILLASDIELEREINDMFRHYSTKQIGTQVQKMVAEVTAQLKEGFSSSKFKAKFGEILPGAVLILSRNLSWFIGYRLRQNLHNDPQITRGLLEAISRHGEICAAMEQYRCRNDWDGDRNIAIELAWQAMAPKYFSMSSKMKAIIKDGDQEKLIGVSQGLENYTGKNRAIDALTDGFLGKLGAYLKKAAQNQETDYHRKQKTDGNRVLTKAAHAEDLRHPDNQKDGKLSDDEIFSREKEKRYFSHNSLAEETESKETIKEWWASLTEKEKTAIDLKSVGLTETEIADKMGICHQRVSQLLSHSMRKYRKIKYFD